MTAWLYRALVQAILGPAPRVTAWLVPPHPLAPYFTDAPRKRPKQTVTGPRLITELALALA